MKKIILWSVAGILIIGICIAGIWWLRRPQVIQLDKNTKLTLLGVEYGKHHKFPKIPTTGRRNFGGQGSFDTTNDTLVVYILQETKGQNRYSWQSLVYDTAGTACTANWARNWNSAGGNKQIAAIQVDAFPRWDGKFDMHFSSWGPQGQRDSKEYFVVSNPARKTSFPKWTAEAIPDTQSDDDLTATLEKFNYNVPFNHGNRASSSDAVNKAVFVQFHTEQKGAVVTNWQAIHIETSDASGNHIMNNSWSTSRDPSGDATMTYQPGLWPAQTPWKLRVEFSRSSGFTDDEIWSVTNVPIKPGTWNDMWGNNGNRRTNSAIAETTLGGFHLKLFPIIQFTDQNRGNGQKPGGFRIQADESLDGMQMTLVKATDENGRDVPFYGGNSWNNGNSHQFQIENLRNAQSLNLTVAVHKSRFIEFTATPTKQ